MCYQPITIKTPQGYKEVPCGKCLECLRKYQSDWSNRMYEELKAHNGKAVFFTLTYDEQNVPKNYLYDYHIYRSPSDYGYNNTYVDEKGKTKVLPSRRGERKHFSVDPYKELEDLGVDCSKIIDFNIKRTNHKQFMDKIKKIYGDYLKHCDIVTTSLPDPVLADEYDFDTFGEDLFNFETEETVVEEEIIDNYRERPIMMFNSVRKKDIQDWIKRARQRRKRDAVKNDCPEQKFTFFVTSEYGPRTLRPHYHGVLFGVTAQETMDMRNDWVRHHGKKISWDDVDLSKGDMSYCAKYCSKGFYEHPLCSKDFFYPKPTKVDDVEIRPFTEYHSKHYERCIELFGMDEPIVDPTFHLVSKGLGVSWVDEHQYLVEDFKDFFDLDYKESDVKPTIKVVRNRVEYEPPQSVPDLEDCVESCDLTLFPSPSLTYDLSLVCNLTEEEIEPLRRKIKEIKSKDYEECINRLFERFKYTRTFKGKNIAYGVPKYYRSKIFSDGLRCAFANFICQINVELYQEKLDELRASDPAREDAEIVLLMERERIQEKYRRMRDVRKKVEKQYDKSRI